VYNVCEFCKSVNTLNVTFCDNGVLFCDTTLGDRSLPSPESVVGPEQSLHRTWEVAFQAHIQNQEKHERDQERGPFDKNED
jgi:hypothetical protein